MIYYRTNVLKESDDDVTITWQFYFTEAINYYYPGNKWKKCRHDFFSLSTFTLDGSHFDMEKLQDLSDALQDVNAVRNIKGYTVLMCHSFYNTLESLQSLQHSTMKFVRFLLEGCDPPADPSIRAEDGSTALHCALCHGKVERPDLIRLLLEHGADRSIRNNSGDTALDYAKTKKWSACVSVLENYLLDDRAAASVANAKFEKERPARERAKRERVDKFNHKFFFLPLKCLQNVSFLEVI
jgi:ankyrin repeat protein